MDFRSYDLFSTMLSDSPIAVDCLCRTQCLVIQTMALAQMGRLVRRRDLVGDPGSLYGRSAI